MTDVTLRPTATGLRFARDDERAAHHRRQLPPADAEPVRARVLRRSVRAVPGRAGTGSGAPEPDRRVGAVPLRRRAPRAARPAPVGRGTAREPAAARRIRPTCRRSPKTREQRGNHTMLNLDPPDHHRLRRLVSKVFTPRMIEGLRPRVQQLVDEYLDAVEARGTGEIDVIADLAFPLPFIDHLGDARHPRRRRPRAAPRVVGRDRERLRPDPHARGDASRSSSPATRCGTSRTSSSTWKRAHPGDDLLTGMIAAEDEGDRLTPEELVEQLILLYVAGHETTVNLIGNGTLALMRHRDQLELLQRGPDGRSDDGRRAAALRQPGADVAAHHARPTTRSTATTSRPGTLLMTCLGSANRDPREVGRHRRPARPAPRRCEPARVVRRRRPLVPGRAPRRASKGARRSRRLVRRFPNVELATDQPEWNGRIVLRGLNALPLRIA